MNTYSFIVRERIWVSSTNAGRTIVFRLALHSRSGIRCTGQWRAGLYTPVYGCRLKQLRAHFYSPKSMKLRLATLVIALVRVAAAQVPAPNPKDFVRRVINN